MENLEFLSRKTIHRQSTWTFCVQAAFVLPPSSMKVYLKNKPKQLIRFTFYKHLSDFCVTEKNVV